MVLNTIFSIPVPNFNKANKKVHVIQSEGDRRLWD